MRPVIYSLILAFAIACLWPEPPPVDPLLRWMDRIAQQHLDRREKAIAEIQTAGDAERRRREVRAKLLELLGGLPESDGPLNARTLASLVNPSYTLEKVIYESLPGFFVTANLYRPNRPGRYPAVLLSAGHSTLGKTENHRLGANLAAKGFVALSYDPVGLGERIQALDPNTRRHAAGCCANEHLHAGAQSMLIGQSVARYFIWDAKRSIDYLVSRPDVDAERIGAAGCSGGGCVTTYIAAFDPRIKAAAPACFVNSLRVLFAGPFPDSEMSLPGFLAAGLDHADLLEVAAPTPWLILATEGDFFTPDGARLVYDEVRRWYGLSGAADRVRFFVGPGLHGTPLETREAIYGWMIRWLKNGAGDAREGAAVPLYADRDLQVTSSGQVEDEPGSRKLFEVIRAEFSSRREPRSVAPLLKELGIAGAGRSPSVRILGQRNESRWRREQLVLESEPGVEVNAALYVPRGAGRHQALLLVKDSSSAGVTEEAAGSGKVVLELEPRDAPSAYDKRPLLGNWLTNSRADSIGRNLAALRARDIMRGIGLLAARSDVAPDSIRAAGSGVGGVWVLLAAAADPRIGGVWLDRTPHLLRTALDQAVNVSLFDAMIRGFLLHGDLPDLVTAMGDRPVLWTDPVDWMGRRVHPGQPFRTRAPGETRGVFLAELFRESRPASSQ